MTRPFDRLRTYLVSLEATSFSEFLDLADKLDTTAEALNRFARAGRPLDAAVLEKLESWHEITAMRAAMRDDRRSAFYVEVAAKCGISVSDYRNFLDGTIDLDAATLAKFRIYLGNGGAALPQGATQQVGDGGPALTDLLALRGKAKSKINAMSAEELRSFIAA
ncbi:hypothetical protein ACWIEX_06025 [Bosea sp. NPDC055353]